MQAAGSAGGRPLSRAQEAEALGVSERHYRRLRAAERDGTTPWAPDVEAIPYVPIVDGPVDRRWYYRTDDDTQSRLPLGLMRIGEATVERAERGSKSCRERPGRLEGRLGIHHFNEKMTDIPLDKRSRHKFRPKRPKPKKDLLP